jgi:hypothetical protein
VGQRAAGAEPGDGLRQDGRLRGKLIESICSALARDGPKSLKKMVVCAVICEPVSIAIPWYQGILGEIREFQHLQPPCKPKKTAGKRGF